MNRGRGKFPNKFNRGGFHNDHDDRSGLKTSDIKRRVSFKTSVRNHRGGFSDSKVRAFLDDEDMGGDLRDLTINSDGSPNVPRRSNNFRNRRKGSPIPRYGVSTGGKLIVSPAGWYQVLIQHGAKYQKTEILGLIHNTLQPDAFAPSYYKIDEAAKSSHFYVEDHEIAEKIMKMDRKISLPDGFKMMIKVRGSVPQVRIDESLKERIKNAMGKRYNPATKALDLTKFHADPELTDIFCSLARPPIMIAALDIIAENIADLEALNLNDNKINQMDHMKAIPQKLKNLKTLYLGNNKIFMVSSIDNLRGLPLTEAFFEGNPFKNRIRENAHYVSEIKKRFPKLTKLDGVVLGPTIGFDVVDEPASAHLPPWKSMFLVNQNGQELVQKFLQQYYMLYDSDNRQQLLEAYHDNAVLSLTATNNQHYTSDEKLHVYWKCGRNLLHPKGFEYRFSSLKNGKLSVVALLNELPPSRHDPQSFSVDLTLFTPQMIVLTVTGLFKERNPNPKAEYARIFQKTMVIVPNNNGFCIRNEMLHINNASQTQARDAFKDIVVAPPPAPTIPTVANPTVSQQPDEATKMQMIQEMSRHSNMNIEWSRKCLEETQWNFQRAGFVFSQLFKENKIPPEAFVK